MFFRRPFFFILFGVLLLTGLFGGGRGRYTRAYNDGYVDGQAAAAARSESAAETAGSTDAAPTYRAPERGSHWPAFGLFGLLFKFWFIFLAFGVMMKLFGFGRHHHLRHHHRRHRGPHGWGMHEKGPYEKQPQDVEPDVQQF